MKTAVVLFNLGGPDSPEAVKPFLRNLFSDPFIMSVPQPIRSILASFISSKRAAKAKDIYELMGGKSPILENTMAQAAALEKDLSSKGDYKVFVAMRYWHPFIGDVVEQVKAYAPTKVILLPLYPQYSSTTTKSAFNTWYEEAQKRKLVTLHHPVCCYPFDNHFVEGHVELLKEAYEKAKQQGKPRILFSAHGLPEKIIDKGDPYEWQVERTVSSIIRNFGPADYVICFQSRVGPLKWIGPSTEEEIERAGADKVPVVIVPVSFVSEHSETLVELDIEYLELAKNSGVPAYIRVPTLGVHEKFIESLSWLCQATVFYPGCSNVLGRQCPKEFGMCGYKEWKV